MRNNSSSRVEVKASGSAQGADDMMKYEAVGNLILKVLGGVSLLIGSIAALLVALAKAGLV